LHGSFLYSMNPPPVLSIVSPVYRAEAIVPRLVEKIKEAASRVTERFEIVLVEDGSPDNSWAAMELESDKDARVIAIKLTRNFGQQCAITAGLTFATGECMVVLDCDLQDDPAFIPELYAGFKEGYEVVLTRKNTREYGFVRNAITHGFYLLLRVSGDLSNVDPHINSYCLISRRVAQEYLTLEDYHRDFLMLIQWMGFKQTVIPVEHASRYSGESSYSWAKLFRHAVATITAHSKAFLKFSIALGFLYVAAAFATSTYLVISYFLHGYRAGWASTMVMILASTGIMLLAIGTAGIYIGNIFDQVRRRPLFLVQEKRNIEMDSP